MERRNTIPTITLLEQNFISPHILNLKIIINYNFSNHSNFKLKNVNHICHYKCENEILYF
ncbi:hypothetical protein HZS_2508 [Henneguya salminicola]|nr:hypothetical protein HZS_2508 [Henneguya salminicola]